MKTVAISEAILEKLFGREAVSDLLDLKKVSGKNGDRIQFEDLPSVKDLLEKAVSEIQYQTAAREKPASVEISPVAESRSGLQDVEFVFRPMLVMARFSLEHTQFPAFRTAGLHAVGVDIFNIDKSEKSLIAQMGGFLESAKKNSLKTYILGVRTISLYTAAVTEGFDYMAGYALSSVAKKAEDIYAFRLDMPYLSLLESTHAAKGG